MSFNLIAGIEQEDNNNEVRVMSLSRVGAGITHSASVGRGDEIAFGGINMRVNRIIHQFQAPGSAVALVSLAFCAPDHPLSQSEIDVLIGMGFKDE